LGYDKYQRSYLIKTTGSRYKKLEIQVDASAYSPVHNLAIVIEGIEIQHTKIELNNKVLIEDTDYKIGNDGGLDLVKTVVFINVKSEKPLIFSFSDFSK
jgi:hypothetical protein